MASAAWLALVGAVTWLLVLARGDLDKSHAALVYLLVVLGASASRGRRTGLATAIVAFLSLNFFLLPPYHTFIVADPRDWIVLGAFLATGAVAAQLLDRARREAAEARRREAEVARLAAVADRAEALREADRLKDALLASVSHDLRTPLTTIKAVAQQIAASGDERAAAIEEEADRLERLVINLLDLSRLEGARPTLTAEVTAVEDLVGAALQVAAGVLGARTVTFAAERNELLLGRFDLAESVRILVNLLDNAAKYSPPGSPIELSARRDGALLEVAVADRGPGVPEPDRVRIFEPFVRAPARRDAPGSGLGLAIARRLARAQGGDVICASREGGGSRFLLRLPAAEVSAAELER